MKKLLIFALLAAKSYALSISPETAEQISLKIWKNECGGTVEGLTHWGKNEAFPSLGIGHFIWYPEGKRDRFVEGFPPLITYLKTQKANIPAWLHNSCPWNTRDEFYADISSPKMKELRQFLYETRHLQAIFVANRLEKALPQMIENLSLKEKEKITAAFNHLATDPRGLYALIDYVNFKGEGTSLAERYKGQGWGLLQVLQLMPASSVDDFIASAKTILTQRVKNSPPERHEEQWLKGWLSRLETYRY
ncbi:MAG TPA: hypothetical protein VHK67_04160 [Rhabdochlamydiaceae bacterium]|jgi:hypothetical protein|nr:hypothetical protein [Rhabdochlamydiaceae bacterium]